MADFIEMNHADMLRQIAELDKTLANLEKSVSGEIMDTVLHEAAEQLKDEQARILSGAPSDGIRSLAKDLSVWKDNRRPAPRKVSYRAGYSDDKINQSIKYFVIEYGRPGKKGKTTDSKGRRIGRVQPFSHIRAAWFLKKDAINKYIAERINQEILKRWKG